MVILGNLLVSPKLKSQSILHERYRKHAKSLLTSMSGIASAVITLDHLITDLYGVSLSENISCQGCLLRQVRT